MEQLRISANKIAQQNVYFGFALRDMESERDAHDELAPR